MKKENKRKIFKWFFILILWIPFSILSLNVDNFKNIYERLRNPKKSFSYITKSVYGVRQIGKEAEEIFEMIKDRKEIQKKLSEAKKNLSKDDFVKKFLDDKELEKFFEEKVLKKNDLAEQIKNIYDE